MVGTCGLHLRNPGSILGLGTILSCFKGRIFALQRGFLLLKRDVFFPSNFFVFIPYQDPFSALSAFSSCPFFVLTKCLELDNWSDLKLN